MVHDSKQKAEEFASTYCKRIAIVEVTWEEEVPGDADDDAV